MPKHQAQWGELTDADFALIKMVVDHVVEFGEIPNMASMAQLLGCTRQGVLRKMEGAAKRGLLRERPRYATRWFELTPLGEDRYRERAGEQKEAS